VCLPFLACVLRFTCRKSLFGKVNNVVLGWLLTKQWCNGCRTSNRVWLEAESPMSHIPPIKFSLPLGRSGHVYVKWYQDSGLPWGITHVSPLDSSCFHYPSKKKSLQKYFHYPITLLCPTIFQFSLLCWILVLYCVVVFVVSRSCSWSLVSTFSVWWCMWLLHTT